MTALAVKCLRFTRTPEEKKRAEFVGKDALDTFFNGPEKALHAREIFNATRDPRSDWARAVSHTYQRISDELNLSPSERQMLSLQVEFH